MAYCQYDNGLLSKSMLICQQYDHKEQYPIKYFLNFRYFHQENAAEFIISASVPFTALHTP